MPRETPWEDEYTLLCERCGYVVEGLDTSLPCPECGKPIEESLPERRVGTPWQQSPGFRSLLATWWMTVRHPIETLDSMRLDPQPKPELALRTLVTSSTIVYLLIMAAHILNPYTSKGWVGMAIAAAVMACVCVVGFLSLTEIERLGLVFISDRRGFRIKYWISKNIVSHGAVGWVWCGTCAALWLYTMDQGMMDGNELYAVPPWSEDNFVSGYEIQTYYRPLPKYFFLASLIGFLFFEVFAYLGLRRLKYANRVRPEGEPTEPGTASS